MSSKVDEYGPKYPEPVAGFDDFGHVELEHVANCRDLGGLPCADGRRVKHGRLMRSAELHHASESDMKALKGEHDLERVVDLRTAFEMERQSDPIPKMAGVEYVNLAPIENQRDLEGGGNDDFAVLKHLAEDTPAVFFKMYREMVTSAHSIQVFKRFLDILLENGSGATLWHCTQGKDRTGLAAMFAERALGASMETIRADYLATNLFSKPEHGRIDAFLRDIPLVDRLQIDKEAATYAHMPYLDAALETIQKQHGSLDEYIVDVLDFGAEKQAKLREMYLD